MVRSTLAAVFELIQQTLGHVNEDVRSLEGSHVAAGTLDERKPTGGAGTLDWRSASTRSSDV